MRIAIFAAVAASLAGPALAQAGADGDPAAAGLSPERLRRAMAVLDGEVAAGRIAGAVFAVERHGKVVWLGASGYRDKAARVAMTTDTIFPLASMTKPIASVVAMTLVEQGKLSLRDPVAKYLPAFGQVRVATEPQGGPAETPGPIATEALRRPITIQDLLRHTAGMVNGGLFTRTKVRQAYFDAGVYREPQTLAEAVDKMATVPLAYQPGTQWDYSQSTDVLARVAEIVSGKGFDELVAETVTGPLGMADTGFNVAAADRGRVARPAARADGSLPPHEDGAEPTRHFGGGGGLFGTAPDYLRFMQMLLGHGSVGAVRILGGGTVELMRSDALGPIGRGSESGEALLGPGYSFGLGFAVRTADGLSAQPGSKGAFGWAGAYGTQFVIDPRRDLAAVLMVDQWDQFPRMLDLFNALLAQAIED